MIIVANTFMLNIFKQISIFKLDLGQNLISLKEEKIVIKDPFMLRYLNITGKQILTYGSICKLIFYQDYTLKAKDFYIFNDETIYALTYLEDDSKYKSEEYLASIIKEINEKEGIKENTEKIETNKKPDITLSEDQYIQEMIKKRRIENGK